LRQAGFAVVSFDQPGHGHSTGKWVTLPHFADTLLAVGRHYGEACGVVAHSLGGAATTLALSAGLAARRVVLIAPSLDPVAAVARFAKLVRLPPRLHEALHAQLAAFTGVSIHDLQAAPLLHARTQPMFIAHDHDDHDVPFVEGQAYAQGWPAARFRDTTGLGHHHILVDPGVVGEAVEFLMQGL
jgi:pimeloyl-ACP methyl ester carboxylesterase